MDAELKLISFRAENVMKVKVVELTEEDLAGKNMIILEGENGAGKSAVLNSFLMALTGKKFDEPIHEGQSRAEIEIDLNEYVVKRVITAKGDRLEVTGKDGARYTSGQALLDKLMGKLTFDPLAFMEMGKTESGKRSQRELLAKLVGLDFTTLDQQRKEAFDTRTIKHRQIKGGDPTKYRPNPNEPLPLESLISAMEKPEAGLPRQEYSLAEAYEKVDNLRDKRRARQIIEGEITTLETSMDTIKAQTIDEYTKRNERIRQQIDDLQHEIKVNEEKIAFAKKQVDDKWEMRKEKVSALHLLEDVTDEQLNEAIAEAKKIEELNKKIQKAVEYDRKLAELSAANKEIEALEEIMFRIDLEKKDRVKKAQFPIAGLSLTDEYITFNDKPFSQLSTGEAIRVSTAIAMALNPTLKTIFIREGSLLDRNGKAEVLRLAKERGYQVIMEVVADEKSQVVFEEGEARFFMKDGEVQR